MDQKSNPIFSIWPNAILTICILTTFVALSLFAAYDYETDKSNNAIMVSHIQLEEVHDRLDLLSDLLTTSATLAAKTGDKKWLVSYRQYKTEWMSIIRDNPDIQKYVSPMEDSLSQIEHEASLYAEKGDLERATKLITSGSYLTNEELLDIQLDKIKIISSNAEIKNTSHIEEYNTKRLHFLWSIITIGSLLWLLAFFLINHYRKTAIKFAREIMSHNDSLQKLNLELFQSNTELDNFVYSASHHLLGPVKSSLGLITVFDKGKDELTLEKFLEMMEGNLKKIDDNIKAMIFLSENRRSEIVKTEFELGPVLMEAINQAELKSNIQGVTIETEVDNCTEICTDKNRLKVILASLISNALQYQDKTKSQKMNVKGFCSGTNIELTIEDSGIGIPEEKLGSIFGMFVKLNEMSTGPGLGLYITKEILNKLSGTIQINSTLGQGTTAKITIPL